MLEQEQTDCEDRFHSVIMKLKTTIDKKNSVTAVLIRTVKK